MMYICIITGRLQYDMTVDAAPFNEMELALDDGGGDG